VSEISAVGGPQVQTIACEFPMPGGCPHVMEYSGVGRKPRYCQQVVDGLRHAAYTAHRVASGAITVPDPGSQPASRASDAAPLRPVTQARATAAKLHEQLGNLVDRQLQPLVAQLVEALHVAADPDSATSEVDAAHREARTRIDIAEAAAEDALARAVTAERAAETARTAQAAAEQTADQALTDLDEAREQRDQHERAAATLTRELAEVRADLATATAEGTTTAEALAETHREVERLTAQLATAESARDEARTELAATNQHVHDLIESRDEARTALATERRELGEQRRRAELAEQHTARDELTISSLTEQLTAARDEARDQHERAATARAEIAAATVQIEALREAATAAADHAEQRFADLRARHDEQLADLRAQLYQAHPQTGANTS
jgi:hypothetical protein